MAFIDLVDHPVVVGMYDNGKTPQYSIELPLKGHDIQSAFLGDMTILEAQTEMDARKLRFEQHRNEALVNTTEWINIGYVIDSTGMTAYYQIKLPDFSFSNVQYTNWPLSPPVYEENT